MMTRVKPPFRADHVGSSLRSKALLDAREQHKNGNDIARESQAAKLRLVVETAREVWGDA